MTPTMSDQGCRQGVGVLMIIENLPVPLDRRSWQEATALRDAGYRVSIICPTGKDYPPGYTCLDGIHIYRHPLPIDASGSLGYILEYATALFFEFVLAHWIKIRRGFKIIHAANPPDLTFLVAGWFKFLFGTRFIFDHHDVNPELYEVKFSKRGIFYKIVVFCERATFRLCDVSLATNDTFRDIALGRGGMRPENVFVVKGYPDRSKFYRVPADDLRDRFGRHAMVGYLGIINIQDGVELLLRALATLFIEHKRSDLHGLIIGDGPDLPRLRTIADQLQLSPDQVTFTGYLKGDALLRHLSIIDIGVIPDPYNIYNDKVTMNKVSEYMMLGIPIVHFGLTENSRDAEYAGLSVEANNPTALAAAIARLVDDPDQRRAMAAFGRNKAEAAFAWEKQKQSLLAAYARALSIPVGRGAPTRRPARLGVEASRPLDPG